MTRESGDKLSGMLSEEHLVFHLQVGRLEHLQPNKVGYKLTRPVESLWLQGEAVVPSQRRTGRCLKAAAFGPGKSQTHRPPPVPKQNSANFIRGRTSVNLSGFPTNHQIFPTNKKCWQNSAESLPPLERSSPAGTFEKENSNDCHKLSRWNVSDCAVLFIGMSQTPSLSACHKLLIIKFVTNSLVGTCRLVHVLGLLCPIYRHVTKSSCIILSKLYEETFENAQ